MSRKKTEAAENCVNNSLYPAGIRIKRGCLGLLTTSMCKKDAQKHPFVYQHT
jgi:hypothetical protein